MIKKSEVIICAVAATGLLAYSVAHQVDPLFASQALAEAALALTISGIKTVAYFGLQTTKSVAVVAGTYFAIKGTALTVSTLKNKIMQRLQKPVLENEQEFEEELEDELEDELEEELEGELEEELEEQLEEQLEEELDLEDLPEVDSENDMDSDGEEYKPRMMADIAFKVDEEDALTNKEIECLLIDQTRVSFLHADEKVPPLTPIQTVYEAGPYSLRPRM